MKCMFCNKEVYSDEVHVKSDNARVTICQRCAASHSLYEFAVHAANIGAYFPFAVHSEELIVVDSASSMSDAGLTGQTEDVSEYAKNKVILSTEYGMQVQGYPGRIPNCPLGECDECHFFYGELDSCMVGEPGVTPTEEDIEKVRAALGDEAAKTFFEPDTEVVYHDTDSFKSAGLTGQTDERAMDNEELVHDIDNMSHEDFFSKYAGCPEALHAYVNANGEPADAFLNI